MFFLAKCKELSSMVLTQENACKLLMEISCLWKRLLLNMLSSLKHISEYLLINICPVVEFLKRRFKFELGLLSSCDSACQTLQYISHALYW